MTQAIGAALDTHSSLLAEQLAFMHASAESENREILSDEYPQWSLEREAIVKSIKSSKLTRPVKNRR